MTYDLTKVENDKKTKNKTPISIKEKIKALDKLENRLGGSSQAIMKVNGRTIEFNSYTELFHSKEYKQLNSLITWLLPNSKKKYMDEIISDIIDFEARGNSIEDLKAHYQNQLQGE